MPAVCFYFQVHQPYRVKRYSYFNGSQNLDYFDDQANRFIMQKVAEKCYIPTNEKMLDLMKKQVEKLQKDAKNATRILGVKDIEFENFPDNELDKITNLELTKKIERLINDYKPQVVFTHTQHDINVDHRSLYYATITATRPTKINNVKEVFSFEVPSSSEWLFSSTFTPNVFVDISKELGVKLRALRAYKNEIRAYPHPRSVKALEIISKRWGTVSGFSAAEAFHLVRQLRDKF